MGVHVTHPMRVCDATYATRTDTLIRTHSPTRTVGNSPRAIKR